MVKAFFLLEWCWKNQAQHFVCVTDTEEFERWPVSKGCFCIAPCSPFVSPPWWHLDQSAQNCHRYCWKGSYPCHLWSLSKLNFSCFLIALLQQWANQTRHRNRHRCRPHKMTDPGLAVWGCECCVVSARHCHCDIPIFDNRIFSTILHSAKGV